MKNNWSVIVIGGGAAGIFAAITCAQGNPQAKVLLLEKSGALLSKVRVSGGGRCNVTHACFDPKLLINHYPRGSKALLGPFHRFQPRDTIAWFEARGVELKTEEDGRMFPVTDSSQTIIDCLLKEVQKCGVEIRTLQRIETMTANESGFQIHLASGESLHSSSLILATGSSSQGHAWAQSLGHHIEPPVPSLFTFNVPSSPLLDLAGITVETARIKIAGTALEQTGPLLLTHWGFSGPAALKLSAWGARELYQMAYKGVISINWLPDKTPENFYSELVRQKTMYPSQTSGQEHRFGLPKNLWKRLLEVAGLDPQKKMGAMSNHELRQLTGILLEDSYQVEGKTTHKQEFVTCGGIRLDEINFKTMESKLCPSLFFAGEMLDIDGITGGFNFQNAWTTAWIAGQAIKTGGRIE